MQATGLDKQSAKAYQKRATRLSKTTDRLAGATIALNLGVFGVFLSRMTTGHPKLDAAIYYGGTGLALVSTAVTYILGYRADILKEKAGVLRAGEHVVVGQQGRP